MKGMREKIKKTEIVTVHYIGKINERGILNKII